MTEDKKAQIEKLIENLRGTCQNMVTLAEDYDLDPSDPEVCELVDAEIFECDCCGWWFERSDESRDKPGCCDDCEPNDDGSDD